MLPSPFRPPRAPRSTTRERYESHNGGGRMANGIEKDSSSYKRRSRSMESFGFNNANTRNRSTSTAGAPTPDQISITSQTGPTTKNMCRWDNMINKGWSNKG